MHECGLSHVRLFVTPRTVACQAPLSMGFCRQEYWSGLPCPPPGDLPDPGIKSMSPVSPAFQADSLPLSHLLRDLPYYISTSVLILISKENKILPLLYDGLIISQHIPAVKENWRRPGFNSWVGKIPWKRTWPPTPVSCLGNPMDRGDWQVTVHGVAKSWTWLSN